MSRWELDEFQIRYTSHSTWKDILSIDLVEFLQLVGTRRAVIRVRVIRRHHEEEAIVCVLKIFEDAKNRHPGEHLHEDDIQERLQRKALSPHLLKSYCGFTLASSVGTPKWTHKERTLTMGTTQYFALLENADGGDLHEWCRKSGGEFRDQAVVYAWQMLHGLSASHASHIFHFDLKPQNIFLMSAESRGVPIAKRLHPSGSIVEKTPFPLYRLHTDQPSLNALAHLLPSFTQIASIGDWGTARRRTHPEIDGTMAYYVWTTYPYAAPELVFAIGSFDPSTRRFLVPVGAPTDVFSMGMTLLECFLGAAGVPFLLHREGSQWSRVFRENLTHGHRSSFPAVERVIEYLVKHRNDEPQNRYFHLFGYNDQDPNHRGAEALRRYLVSMIRLLGWPEDSEWPELTKSLLWKMIQKEKLAILKELDNPGEEKEISILERTAKIPLGCGWVMNVISTAYGSDLVTLLKEMLAWNPRKRITASEALERLISMPSLYLSVDHHWITLVSSEKKEIFPQRRFEQPEWDILEWPRLNAMAFTDVHAFERSTLSVGWDLNTTTTKTTPPPIQYYMSSYTDSPFSISSNC